MEADLKVFHKTLCQAAGAVVSMLVKKKASRSQLVAICDGLTYASDQLRQKVHPDSEQSTGSPD